MLSNNAFATHIAQRLSPYLKKYELPLVALATISYSTNYYLDIPAYIILVIAANTLAALYFLEAFVLGEMSKPWNFFFGGRMLGYAWAISVIGILFYLQKWNGGNIMLMIGPIGIIIAHILLAIPNKTTKESNENKIIGTREYWRSAILVFIFCSIVGGSYALTIIQ